MEKRTLLMVIAGGAAAAILGTVIWTSTVHSAPLSSAGSSSAPATVPTVVLTAPPTTPPPTIPAIQKGENPRVGANYVDGKNTDLTTQKATVEAALTAYVKYDSSETQAARTARLSAFFPTGSDLAETPPSVDLTNEGLVSARTTVKLQDIMADSFTQQMPDKGLQFLVIGTYFSVTTQNGQAQTNTGRVIFNVILDPSGQVSAISAQ